VPGKRNALLIGDSIAIQYAPAVRELLGDEWGGGGLGGVVQL